MNETKGQNKMKMIRIAWTFVSAVMLAVSALADPSVTISRVQQQWPWNGKVDVDCTLSGLVEGLQYDLTFFFEADGQPPKPMGSIGVTADVNGSPMTYTFDAETEFGAEVMTELKVTAQLAWSDSIDVSGIIFSGEPLVTYDAAPHTFSPSYSGDLPAGITGVQITYTDKDGNPVDAPKDAGEYTATMTFTVAEGYTQPAVKTTNLTINPKGLTIKGLTATDREYDGTEAVFVSGDSLDDVCAGDDVSVDLTKLSGTVATKDAGTNKFVTVSLPELSGAAAANYTLAQPTNLTVNISPRTAELAWGTLSFQYDGESHLPTCSVANLVQGDSCEVTVEGDAQTAVGTYTVTATGLLNQNYALLENVRASWTITSMTLDDMTITVEPDEYVYDGTAKMPSVKIGNLVKDTDFTLTYSDNINAGTGTVTATGFGGYAGSLTGTFLIKKAQLSVDDIAFSNRTMVANSKTPGMIDYQIPENIANLVTANVTYTKDGVPVTAPTEAGEYVAVLTIESANSNYELLPPTSKQATLTLVSPWPAEYMVIDIWNLGNKGCVKFETKNSWAEAHNSYVKDTYKKEKLVLRRIKGGIEYPYLPGEPTSARTMKPKKDFYIGIFEVSMKHWDRVHHINSDQSRSPKCPITWNKIRSNYDNGWGFLPTESVANDSFMARLQDGCIGTNGVNLNLRFDLPTAVQFNIAALAGSTNKWGSYISTDGTAVDVTADNIAQFARYVGSDSKKIQMWGVGELRPNPLGLYDMLGNAQEWVRDYYYPAVPNVATDVETPVSLERAREATEAAGEGFNDFEMERLICGGLFNQSFEDCHFETRTHKRPDVIEPTGSLHTGFRVVAFEP